MVPESVVHVQVLSQPSFGQTHTSPLGTVAIKQSL